ncbi:MAG: sigma-70 family RNA polymerase sigma factor, partial [Chloroflexota bacterium]
WLFRIARGKLIDHYRRSARRPVADLTDSLPADEPDPGDSVQTNETWRELQAALAKLTDEQRDVIQFRFIEDWSLEETARVMNKSVNAIKALQHRALNTLHRHMAPQT